MAAVIRNERVLLLTDFFLIFFTFSCGISLVFGENSLYKDEDPMVQLNNDTIYNHLEGAKKIWMVEFYSSWCGHCQSFAPKWVNFSWQIRNWRKYVDIGVVNCAAERNFDTCVEFGIDMYPTIKFFNTGWKRPPKESESKTNSKEKRKLPKKSNKFGVDYEGDKQIRLMRRSLIDQIEKHSDLVLPSDKLFSFASEDDIETTKNTGYTYLLLVFEKPDSYVGKNLILDTTDSKSIIVRRVSSHDIGLMRKYKVTRDPAIVLIKLSDQKTHIIQSKDNTYNGFVNAINQVEHVIEKPAPPDKKMKTTPSTTIISKEHSSEVNIKDLVSAIAFSLRREVPKKVEIDSEQLEVLKHWVILLWKCVPVEKPLRKFLAKLNRFLDTKEDSLSSKEYLHFIDSTQTAQSFLPTEISWAGCKGSDNKYRGFPCGLWTLFHTITVTCAAKNLPEISSLNVVIGIRDFIDVFFGCRHCRNHFMKMAASVRGEVSNHDQAILWLWKSHNKVNARLKEDISSDPAYPKIQFPPKSLCEECRKPTDPHNILVTDPGYSAEKIEWNGRVLLEFLKKHYGPDNIRIRDAPPAKITDVDAEDSEFVSYNPYDITTDDDVTNESTEHVTKTLNSTFYRPK